MPVGIFKLIETSYSLFRAQFRLVMFQNMFQFFPVPLKLRFNGWTKLRSDMTVDDVHTGTRLSVDCVAVGKRSCKRVQHSAVARPFQSRDSWKLTANGGDVSK
jgi:hypothetical protein